MTMLLVQRLAGEFSLEAATRAGTSGCEGGVADGRFLFATVAAAVPLALAWTRLGCLGDDSPACEALARQIVEGGAVHVKSLIR